MTHPVLSSIFLFLAAAIALIFTIGLAIMRDPFQKLHFSSPIVALCPLFISVAVFLENSDPAARFKVVIISVVLFLMNSVLSHATGKAIRIRDVGQWPVQIKEGIPLVNRNVLAGDNEEKPAWENPI